MCPCPSVHSTWTSTRAAAAWCLARSDVYRSFSQAYDKVMLGNKYNSRVKRVPAVRQFDLCYDVGYVLPAAARPAF
ncbi:hypothetical protein EJB05_16535, partial [Eragrostis curvula]